MGSGVSTLMRLATLSDIDDGKRTTEVHQYNPHGNTWIQVVYTNEGSTLDRILTMYDDMLKDEDDKFVGLDLEYDWNQERIAVIQLAIKEHVLVFHIIRCKDRISSLKNFLSNKGYTFVGVDITTDSMLLNKEWLYIPEGKHIDLQEMFMLPGHPRTGMTAMAEKLIHPKYAGMKDKFVTDFEKRQCHAFWEYKPLSDMNQEYAATDAYVTYELCRIITIVNQGRRQLTPFCASVTNNEAGSSFRGEASPWLLDLINHNSFPCCSNYV